MRARNLKPGFFKNEFLAETTPLGQLLFAGLWCMADRDGRMENRPLRMKAELFPYTKINVIRLLNELSKRGFITIYGENGQFIQIEKFHLHQSPNSHEKQSEIPPHKPHSKTEAVKCICIALSRKCNAPLNPPSPSPSLNPESLFKDKDPQTPKGGWRELAFEELWTNYPSRVKKKTAIRSWLASVKSEEDVSAARLALKNYLASDRVKRGFIQNGSTWFAHWRDWVVPPESTPGAIAVIDTSDPLAKVIRCYKILRGVDKDDRTWDAGHWADSVTPAQRILEVFGGDWRAAVGYMQEQAEKFTADKLSWKFETLVKYADEYKARTSYAKTGS